MRFFTHHANQSVQLIRQVASKRYQATFTFQSAPLPSDCLLLPNPNIPYAGDVIDAYPEVIRSKMDARVKDTIRSASKISSVINLNAQGRYQLTEGKKQRAPYDDFLCNLSKSYGTDPLFKAGPAAYDHCLSQQLQWNREYIFAIQPSDDAYHVAVLPRTEILEINGQLVEGRHIHKEFLQGNEQDALLVAGTMFQGDNAIAYNFRSGHFMCHTDEASKLSDFRHLFFETVKKHVDATAPSGPLKDWKQEATSKSYLGQGSGAGDKPAFWSVISWC